MHLLLDARESDDNVAIKNFKDFIIPSNNGWMLSIGSQHPVATFVGTVILQMLRVDFKFVESIDEAVATLKRVDLNLPPTIDTTDIIIVREFN